MQETKQKTTKTTKKDAVARVEHSLPSPLINSMEDLHIFSQAVFKAEIWRGIKNPESAMIRIQAGRELGLQPIMALNKIHVTPKNDIIIATAVLGAVAMAQGVRWEILQKDPKGCRLRIFRKDGDIPEHTESFTMEDAVRAKLAWKDNYKMYPEEMCFNRCLSKGLRVFDPRIGAGFYTKEEMEDVDKFGEQKIDSNALPRDEDASDQEIILEGEVVSEEEEYQGEVDKAMEETEDPGPQEDPRQPKAPEVDDNPEYTAELKKKEADIKRIKDAHVRVLKLDLPDFKQHLFDVQKTKVFVGMNKFNHLSLHEGTADAIAFLADNYQKFMRKYVDLRMKSMKPGEQIGCFVVPYPEASDA